MIRLALLSDMGINSSCLDKDGISLKGFYLRPEVMYSHYNYSRRLDGGRTLANMGAVLGTVGYQYVYRRFLADFWVGGGYAIGNPAETHYHHGFELWHWFDRVNTNIAMSFSIEARYLLLIQTNR